MEVVAIADGLGHGQSAAVAAIDAAGARSDGDLLNLFQHLNEALRPRPYCQSPLRRAQNWRLTNRKAFDGP